MTDTTLDQLATEYQQVIENAEARPWIQDRIQEGDSVCAHGAVRTCNIKPGDEHTIRAVMRAHGLTEDWNDEDGRTKREVLRKLRTIEITDAALERTFGPQWLAVVDLVRATASLTVEQSGVIRAALNAARNAAQTAAQIAAWDAARNAAQKAAWGVAQKAAWGVAWDAAWSAAQNAAWDAAQIAAQIAARDAARALCVRDLISDVGFTQEHYDILTRPLRQAGVIVHPDDAPLTKEDRNR